MLIKHCRDNSLPFFVAGLKGSVDKKILKDTEHIQINIGQLGYVINSFKEAGVTDIVMIGGVNKSDLFSIIPDWEGIKFLGRMGLRMMGDNTLLEEVIKYFEGKGFRVRGIDEFLQEKVLGAAGVITKKQPKASDWVDIKYGIKVVRRLGELDVGQAAVVQNGVVLGVEGIEGTDKLIKRCKELRFKGKGGVLVKLKKPEQERRADLPAIGIDTLEKVSAAGLEGIVYEAGATLIAGQEKVIEQANKLKLFLVGLSKEELKV